MICEKKHAVKRSTFLIEFVCKEDLSSYLNWIKKQSFANILKCRIFEIKGKYKILCSVPCGKRDLIPQISEFGFCRKPLKIDIAYLNEYGQRLC
jgi:hypothetical protein